MDDPADPFDTPIPHEVVEQLRKAFPPEVANLFERHFSAAKHDYEALLAQTSMSDLAVASLGILGEDRAKSAAILVHAIGRARFAADPDGFLAWMLG